MENFKNKYDLQIRDNIKNEMKKTFLNLNLIDLEIVTKYIYYLILISSEYFTVTQSHEDYYNKLVENNYQDVYSLLILLLPFFNLNNASKIKNLNELLFNSEKLNKDDLKIKTNTAKTLESLYHVDNKIDNIEEYFDEMLLIINDCLSKVSSKLCPNWLNIRPVVLLNDKMSNSKNSEYYKNSNYYKNFMELFENKKMTNSLKKFWSENKINNTLSYAPDKNKFLLGNDILYGVISNFLFRDIKDIKWMIYDFKNKNRIFPTIIVLESKLNINDIISTPWDKTTDESKKLLTKSWENIQIEIKSDYDTLKKFKSLILFYLRSIKNNKQKMKKLKISKKCKNILFKDYDDDENDIIEENQIYDERDVEFCVVDIISEIKCEDINKYIFESMQQFRYTWYGFMCTSPYGFILTEAQYIEKYKLFFGKTYEIKKNNKVEGYITLKIFYNYFKLLTLNNFSKDKFTGLSKSGKWDSLTNENKNLFINKINRTDINEWFNIKNTLRIVYKNNADIDYLHSQIIEKFKIETFLPEIVITTLVINGMLSHVKHNESLTNNKLIPNKNINKAAWGAYMTSRLNIDKNSHSFLSNTPLLVNSKAKRWTKYIQNEKNLELMKNKKGYNEFDGIKTMGDERIFWGQLFGSNWIAQIQAFAHYLNQRVIYITGATGAGKSTVVPILLLYAEKSLNFNNNAKLYCSQPRTAPTQANTERMAQIMGHPIIEEESELTNKFSKDVLQTSEFKHGTNKSLLPINYMQYKYKGSDIEDNYYHPTLRLYTDGTLYNDIKSKFLLKEQLDVDDPQTFGEKNMCDILLVDESHEHNTYMDMILTLLKFSVYANNSITLGIVSATMENDEEKYRKYYSIINDNWKYPLDIRYLYDNEKINKSLFDRRFHVSPPFETTNYKITEITKYKLKKIEEQDSDKINNRVQDILNIILKEKVGGDILIFLSGEKDIKELLKKINETTADDILAIPYYKNFNKAALDNIVKEIQDENVRCNIINPKNIGIDEDIKNLNKTVPRCTYKRFIILATNIAEASITINTLSYVIDTGTEKVKKYDYITKEDKLVKQLISFPSKTQRKGRIGRTKAGYVYYTYDISDLRKTMLYKICVDNISEHIIKLLTETTQYLINDTNDPYTTNVDNIIDILKNQYMYVDNNGNDIKYNNLLSPVEKIQLYPFIDGKYDLETLKDKDFKFYLIHPNEMDKDSQNKVELIANYYKSKNYINYYNTLTKLGTKVVAYSEYFEFQIELSNILIDLIDNWKTIKDKPLLEKIISFIIIKTMNLKIRPNMNEKSVKTDSDFLNFFLKYVSTAREHYALLKNKSHFDNQKESNEVNNLNLFLDRLDKTIEEMHKINNSIEMRYIINYLKNNGYEEESKEKEEKLERIESGKNYNKNYKQFIKKIFKIDKTNVLKQDIFLMNDYEQLCFFIIKNVPNNLYIKILGTIYYINYINRNINSIFSVECIGKKLLTNIPSSYINYMIYALKTDGAILSNIMWIPKIVLDKVNNYNKNILNINVIHTLNRQYCIDKYDDKFNIIYENLSEIKKSLQYK
jgi:hypothetical protein